MKRQRNRIVTLGVSLLIAIIAVFAQMALTGKEGSADSQFAPLIEGLGKYHRPITTRSAIAQRYFDQGLLFVYGYYFPEALASFKQAAELDPQSAMIEWGIAMAIAPNPNSRYSHFPDDPQQLGRQAIEKAWSLRTHASDKERAFIAALRVRYDREKYPEQDQRDAAYAQAMKELFARYPDDPEAGTFYADSLMTMSPWNYWMPDGQPRPGTSEVVKALEHVMAMHPDHPGANHLYVHLFENAQDLARALPEADRLEQTMPGEGHIAHMPSHIYIRVGLYAKAIANNERSLAADKEMLRLWGGRDLPPGVTYPLSARTHSMHANAFITSAATWEGNYARAIEAARALAAGAAAATMNMAANGSSERSLVQPWLTERRFGKWQEILAERAPVKGIPFVEGIWHLVRGSAFTATGKLEDAAGELKGVQSAANDQTLAKLQTRINPARTILMLSAETLAGEMAAARGETDSALLHFEAAIRMEDGLAYMEPPDWDDPVRLKLGAVLLKAKRPSEAEVVYWEDLRRHPENGWALYGLMQSFRAQGNTKEDTETEKRFQKAWANADVKLDLL